MGLPTWAAPLGDRGLRRFLLGNAGSATGTWAYNIAVVIVVFDRTGSASLVALVTAVQFGSSLLLAPVSGAIADRWDRRRLIISTQSASAVAAAALTVGWWAGFDAIALLVVASGILGLLHALGHPAMQAVVPTLSPPEITREALTLLGVSFNAARAIGPIIGVVLLAGPGPAAVFALNTATFIAFALAMRSTDLRSSPVPTDETSPEDTRVEVSTGPEPDRSILAGVRLVRARRDLQICLVGVFGAVFLSEPAATLIAPLAEEIGGGEGLVGALASAFGVGATVLGIGLGWLLRVRSPSIAAGWATIAGAGGLLLVATGAGSVIAICGMAIAGAGFLAGTSNLTTALHSQIDDDVRGRVMAIWSVVFLGSRPVTSIALGTTSDLLGPRVALLLPVVVGLATGAALVATADRFAPSWPRLERSAA